MNSALFRVMAGWLIMCSCLLVFALHVDLISALSYGVQITEGQVPDNGGRRQ